MLLLRTTCGKMGPLEKNFKAREPCSNLAESHRLLAEVTAERIGADVTVPQNLRGAYSPTRNDKGLEEVSTQPRLFSGRHARNHLGIHEDVVIGPQIPNECSGNSAIGLWDKGGDPRLVLEGQPAVVYGITKHCVGPSPGDELRVILSSLDSQGDVFKFTIGECVLESLLDLAVTDGDIKLVLVDVEELCSLPKQVLKLSGWDGTVDPLLSVGDGFQGDEMRRGCH
jgi:hypothetical protein